MVLLSWGDNPSELTMFAHLPYEGEAQASSVIRLRGCHLPHIGEGKSGAPS